MVSARSFPVPDQAGRSFVITGANSGLGFQAAKRIAAVGGHVILAVRDLAKGEEAAARIEGSTEVRLVDTASIASVREFAAGLGSVDVLVTPSAR